jgi:hypothetical protein
MTLPTTPTISSRPPKVSATISTLTCLIKVIDLFTILDLKPENVSKNIRVRVQDKDDDDVSDGEIEDDVI